MALAVFSSQIGMVASSSLLLSSLTNAAFAGAPQVRSAIIRLQFLGNLFGGAVPVDPPITLHTVESLPEGLHHGMGQLLGLELALALHSMAVHLVGQVIIDLPVDPGEDVGAHVVVSSAVGDAGHLEGIHVHCGLAFVVKVMQPHLERSDLQEGIGWEDVFPGECVLLPELNHWLLRAA